jgi:anti-anti-sigma factor
MNLVIDHRPDGIAVLRWPEPTVLDVSNAEQLRQHLDEVERGCARVVLDMSQVEFVDSSIIRALVGLLRRTRAAGGDAKLAALHPDVETIFEVTHLQQVFRIHPTVEAAVTDFAAAPG